MDRCRIDRPRDQRAPGGLRRWGSGTPRPPGDAVEGDLEGRTLKFKYKQPDGEEGEGTFELAPDQASFAGTWKGRKAGKESGGQWTGTRVRPEPGKQWLVILEARWEHGLEEPEYSFGEMLKAFFAGRPVCVVAHAGWINAWRRVREGLAPPALAADWPAALGYAHRL